MAPATVPRRPGGVAHDAAHGVQRAKHGGRSAGDGQDQRDNDGDGEQNIGHGRGGDCGDKVGVVASAS